MQAHIILPQEQQPSPPAPEPKKSTGPAILPMILLILIAMVPIYATETGFTTTTLAATDQSPLVVVSLSRQTGDLQAAVSGEYEIVFKPNGSAEHIPLTVLYYDPNNPYEQVSVTFSPVENTTLQPNITGELVLSKRVSLGMRLLEALMQ